jgi:signal transduction histidine kinase
MLREAERRKDEFLAVLAHELRNPLAPMRNALELLRKQPSQIAHEILDRELRQMTRLVDDLLDTSRITAGRIQLEIEVIELRRLLRTVAESLHPTFEASGQHFGFIAPDEPLYVHGDRIRLLQVFSNLVQNANKYTPPGASSWTHRRAQRGKGQGERVHRTAAQLPASRREREGQRTLPERAVSSPGADRG